MSVLLPLSQIEPAAVETLLDAAFGADRHGRTAYRLRAGTKALPELSFALRDSDGALAATLQSWPVRLVAADASLHPLVLVGPVAVRPDLQRLGLGRMLMDALVAAAEAQRADALVMIGDGDYYGRFWGFDAAPTQGWEVPGPVDRDRLLARIRRVPALPTIGVLGPDLAA